MIQLWNRLSYFGTSGLNDSLQIRNIRISNRINILVIISMSIAFVVMRINGLIMHKPPGLASLKIALIILFSFGNLVLSKFCINKPSKILTAIIPSFLFLYFPLFFGFIEEDAFILYPFVIISGSIVPIIIFSSSKEKFSFYVTVLYYFISVISIDFILIKMAPLSFELRKFVIENIVFYKLSILTMYFFINVSIVYLKSLNIKAENKLELNNRDLIKALTDLQNTQNQLIQSEKMASIGILSAGLAHELNNPVNFIYSGIQSLEENFELFKRYVEEADKLIEKDISGPLKIKIQELKKTYFFDDSKQDILKLIGNIKVGSERTESIVKALKSFSNYEDQGLIVSNINELLKQTVESFQKTLNEQIQISLKLNDLLPSIKCFPGLIRQMASNIVNNAIEAIENKGEIQIGTETIFPEFSKKNQFICISFKDNGKGIADSDLDKIFLPFFTRKEVGQGTGMGLAICHSIIEKHRGKIEVKTEIGKGTAFLVYLPVTN